MSQVVACPKCRKQYRVDDKSIGKNMKCPACQTVFQAKAAATVAATGQTAAAARPQTTASPQEWARYGLDGPLHGSPQLFPPATPQGPDPLSNHIVQDPGFAYVDIEQVRRDRIAAERKRTKLSADDPLEKFKADEKEGKQKTFKQQKAGYLSSYTLFDLEGRINRKKFWLSALFSGLILSAAVFGALLFYFLVLFMLGVDPPNQTQRNLDITTLIPLLLIMLVAGCISFWISIALHVKRYHDLGHPGTRFLLSFIPIIGGIWVLIECGFQEGQRTPNEYGPDPLAR